LLRTALLHRRLPELLMLPRVVLLLLLLLLSLLMPRVLLLGIGLCSSVAAAPWVRSCSKTPSEL